MLISFWVNASALLIVWLEAEMKCSVLFEEIVAAVLGKLKLLFLPS